MRVLAPTIIAIAGITLAGCGSARTATTAVRPPVSPGSSRAQQIALARASNDLFSIFPTEPGSKKCGIPTGGGLRGGKIDRLAGMCTTSTHRDDSHGGALVVTFTEMWNVPGAPCPPGAHCPAVLYSPHHHTWKVIESQSATAPTSRPRVVGTRERGSTAPQYYR